MENYLSARSLATVQRSLLERRSERRTSCVQPGETQADQIDEGQGAGPENQFRASSICLLISRDHHHYLSRLNPHCPAARSFRLPIPTS